VIAGENPRSKKMVAKTKSTKKAVKKKIGKKKHKDIEDPPIIVGGGSSEIIRIREDLTVSLMPPANGYTRFRVAGINIRHVNVDGKDHSVNPNTNSIVFTE
jgi:hypothetical protein